ncbi:MAG: NifU family protein [Sedimentibacter sp.]
MQENIEQILDKYVRPQLSIHYGDIKIIDFTNGILKVKLLGQCSNCPSSKYTVEDIVEKQLREHFPEIEKVELINEISEELLDFARRILNRDNKQ